MSAEVTTIDWGQTPSTKKSRKKSRKKLVRMERIGKRERTWAKLQGRFKTESVI